MLSDASELAGLMIRAALAKCKRRLMATAGIGKSTSAGVLRGKLGEADWKTAQPANSPRNLVQNSP
jgi:hypothetical protein